MDAVLSQQAILVCFFSQDGTYTKSAWVAKTTAGIANAVEIGAVVPGFHQNGSS